MNTQELSTETLALALGVMVRTLNDAGKQIVLRSPAVRKALEYSARTIQDPGFDRLIADHFTSYVHLSAYERKLMALRDEVIAATEAPFPRTELVLLHTLCNARASQIQPFTQADTNYKAELLALAAKLDKMIDAC